MSTTEQRLRTAVCRRFLLRGGGVAVLLVAMTLFCYALGGAAGIVSTNDGSHYALTKALAVDQTIQIDRYVTYTAIQPRQGTPTAADLRDVSAYNGHYYSDRPPGTALLAVPFYWAGTLLDRLFSRPGVDLPLHIVVLLPALLAALTALALYWLAWALGAGRLAALFTAGSVVLATPVLRYATLLYSHMTGVAAVTGSLAVLLLAERLPTRRRPLALAGSGLLLGLAGLAEYPNLLLLLPCGAYLLWRWWQLRERWQGLLAFGLGWCPPIVLLAVYHTLAFGRPWRTSYTYQVYFEWSHSLSTTYVTPLGEGLRWLLFSESGLFVTTPALLLAVWGLLLLARRARARALLLLAVVLMVLLPTSMHRTYYGGGSQDARYLLAIIPTLYAPLGVWGSWVARLRWPLARVGFLLLAGLALVWGFGRALLSLLTFFGHRALDYSPAQAWEFLWKGDNWRDPAVLAPGWPFLPYGTLVVIPLIGLGWCAWAFWMVRTRCRRAAL